MKHQHSIFGSAHDRCHYLHLKEMGWHSVLVAFLTSNILFVFQMGQPDIVLFLECSADIMILRLQQRATCTLHTKEARDRDTRRRVDGFCSLVNPVVSHYKHREVLHKVGMEMPSYN